MLVLHLLHLCRRQNPCTFLYGFQLRPGSDEPGFGLLRLSGGTLRPLLGVLSAFVGGCRILSSLVDFRGHLVIDEIPLLLVSHVGAGFCLYLPALRQASLLPPAASQ